MFTANGLAHEGVFVLSTEKNDCAAEPLSHADSAATNWMERSQERGIQLDKGVKVRELCTLEIPQSGSFYGCTFPCSVTVG